MKTLTASGILVRYVIALALIAFTWNPSWPNYVEWGLNNWRELGPAVMFVGIALVIGWAVFLRSTFRSLGGFGLFLAFALCVAILWAAIRYDWIDPANRAVLAWVLMALGAGILTAGMSWSHLRRRWSGQTDVLDEDDI